MNDDARRPQVAFEVGGRARPSPTAWALRHAQTSLFALGLLARAPVATLLTCAVIGIALALPATLWLVLDNARAVGSGWQGAARISVFLAPGASDADARALARDLQARPEVASTRVITRAQALAEYERYSGFGDVLAAFGGDNPLPAVVVVTPTAAAAADSAALGRFADALGRRANVDLAQLDLDWLRRLGAILDLLGRGVGVIAALLAVGVALIVGNTIRLGIDNRRDEIAISRLFGATDAFIRRPFLYTGLWYGLLGGAVAALLVAGLALALEGPVARLAALYASDFRPSTLGLEGNALLLAAGAGLGLAGSWLAVARHLAAIDPT